MIWAILILTSVASLLGLATLQAGAEVAAHAKQVYKRRGFGMAAPFGCLTAVVAGVIFICWCVYAWQVSDWRFAAIPAVSMFIRTVGEMMFKATNPPPTPGDGADRPGVPRERAFRDHNDRIWVLNDGKLYLAGFADGITPNDGTDQMVEMVDGGAS